MGMPRKGFNTSKSSSPVTMTWACPITAASKCDYPARPGNREWHEVSRPSQRFVQVFGKILLGPGSWEEDDEDNDDEDKRKGGQDGAALQAFESAGQHEECLSP